MNEVYAETSVKKEKTIADMVLKAALIGIAVLSTIIFGLAGFFVVIPIAVVALIVYLFPRLNIQYEYIFCDGQFDFDKLMGNAKRKTVLSIDFEKIDMVAPTGSHSLDQYNNNNQKTMNFSSRREDAKTYTIVGHYKNELVKIIFEPNQKMLDCMKSKAPRKVVNF